MKSLQNASTPNKGILLINVGTPSRPSLFSVAAYLSEFLTDRYVIQLPSFLRYLLVYGLIIPRRAFVARRAYSAIWTKEGSPQRRLMEELTEALQRVEGENTYMVYGMRYGKPSITFALEQLKNKGCRTITVIPLYPQYAEATTKSSLEVVKAWAAQQTIIRDVKVVTSFYQHPAYIEALADSIRTRLDLNRVDHLLMSYHGLPYQQIQRVERFILPACKKGEPCPSIGPKNQQCYRAHCYATSHALAQALRLSPERYGVSFQSRVGTQQWIQPYTTEVLQQLAKRGVKNLAVICPAFVIDCLETLEEIGIRAKKQWKQLGGNEFHLLSCLNNNEKWVLALQEIARHAAVPLL